MGHPQKRTAKIIGASFLVLFLVWQHIQATRLGYEVERSRRETNVIKGRIATLEMELETSLAPAQLAAAAKSRLGMSPATPDALRFIGQPAQARQEETLLSRWFGRPWRSFLHT